MVPANPKLPTAAADRVWVWRFGVWRFLSGTNGAVLAVLCCVVHPSVRKVAGAIYSIEGAGPGGAGPGWEEG